MTVCAEFGALWVQVAGDSSAQDPATCDIAYGGVSAFIIAPQRTHIWGKSRQWFC